MSETKSKRVGQRSIKRVNTVTLTSEEVAAILRREAGAPSDASVRSDGTSIYGDYEVEWTQIEPTP